jgi:hypothetical protein
MKCPQGQHIARASVGSPDNAAGTGIDIDKHDPAIANEFQTVRHRARIVFRAKILHAAHLRENHSFDVSQGTDIARLHFPTDLPLIIMILSMNSSPCQRGEQHGATQYTGENRGESLKHHALVPISSGLNKL